MLDTPPELRRIGLHIHWFSLGNRCHLLSELSATGCSNVSGYGLFRNRRCRLLSYTAETNVASADRCIVGRRLYTDSG